MKRIILTISSCLYILTATSQVSYELSTGFDETRLLNLKYENEKRMREVNENFTIPDYKSPQSFTPKEYKVPKSEVYVPKDLKVDNGINQVDTTLASVYENLDSKNPQISKAAQEILESKAMQSPAYSGVGFENRVKYQEGQEEFNGSVYGFNPYISVGENKKFYARQGYTLSYKYSDKKIYTIVIISVIILIIALYFLSKRKNFEKV